MLILGAPGFQLRFQLRFQLSELIQYSHDLPLHLERRHGDAEPTQTLAFKLLIVEVESERSR